MTDKMVNRKWPENSITDKTVQFGGGQEKSIMGKTGLASALEVARKIV